MDFMTTTRTLSARTGSIFLAATTLTLSACSDDAAVQRVLAETGIERFPEDFVDKTFPVYVAYGELDDGDGSRTDAAVGQATFLSADEIRVSIPGQPTSTYTRDGISNVFVPDDPDALAVEIDQIGAFIFAGNLTEGLSDGGLIAAVGFETPIDDRPPTARYDVDDFATLFLGDPNGEVLTLRCEGCVDLTADFGAATISGQVFNQDTEDGLNITNNLVDGQVTSSGFTGNVEFNVTDTAAFGGPVALDTTLTNQEVIGRFFGVDGEQAMVVYDGDFTVADGEEVVSGNLSGYADAFDSTGELEILAESE